MGQFILISGRIWLLIAGSVLTVSAAAAQEPHGDAVLPAPLAKTEAASAPGSLSQRSACPPLEEGTQCVPPLTPVKLIIRAHLGSKISASGDWFEIELAEPIVVDGVTLVPAGARGMGEVVHAKKSGGSGASGELILAARYLDVDGKRLRLRSLHIAVSGKDAIGSVNTLNVAAAATVPALALIGFFVKGKGIDIPENTVADAKTAEAFVIEPKSPMPIATSEAAPTGQTAPISTLSN
jgi:hypothetical protein